MNLGIEAGEQGTLKQRTALYKALTYKYEKDMIPDGPNGGPIVVEHFLEIERVVALVYMRIYKPSLLQEKWIYLFYLGYINLSTTTTTLKELIC